MTFNSEPLTRNFELVPLALTSLLVLSCCQLWGQGTFGNPGGGFDNYQNSSSNPFSQSLDTTGTDSTLIPDIEPETRWVRPLSLFRHQSYRPLAGYEVGEIHYWDQLDRAKGFVQSLGQTGKPYQVLIDGVEERFFERNLWFDPFFGRYDRYTQGPITGVTFYDTRTPYVSVDYTQTNGRTVITGVTASQNITPRWNMTLFIKRQLSEGIYRDFVTDHTQFWASSNYRSKNDRYWLFASFATNILNDQMNGGVPRSAESGFVLQNGQYFDEFVSYQSSFFGALSSPLLSGAELRRRRTGGRIDQYYHLIGKDDSSVHRLTLRGQADAGRNERSLVDEAIGVSTLSSQLVTPYPTLIADSTDIYEGFRTLYGRLTAEASYTWTPDTGFRIHVDGGLRYSLLDAAKDTSFLTQNQSEQYARGEIRFPWLAVNGRLRQRFAGQLAPEFEAEVGAKLYPLVRRGSGGDTASSPLRLNGQVRWQNLNPTLFQRFFVGDSGNGFLPNPDLSNQNLFYARAGVELVETLTTARDTQKLLPMYFSAGGFFHRIDRQIYYDSALNVRQAAAGEPMQWVGLSMEGRLRLWRHLHLETDTRFQVGTVNSSDASRVWLSRSMPLIHGRTSLYFDYRKVKWAEEARFGLDVSYRTDYLMQAVDTWSGEYFPTNYFTFPYAQVDAFLALRLRGVYVFFKYQHLPEGLFLAGYYTTPFYPMWGRALVLGVNWAFFN